MTRGKRAGARPKRRFRPVLLLLALGITLSVASWGYLVYAAIDFFISARDGQTEVWWWFGVAALGAVCCLFVGLMLIARLSRALGLSSPAEPEPAEPPEPPKPPRPSGGSSSESGGRRAAR